MLKLAFKTVLTLMLFVSLSSCNEQVIVDVFVNLPEEGWAYADAVELEYEIEDERHYYQMYANIQVNGDYDYSNFYIKLTTTSPDSIETSKEVELVLAEKSGKWLGSGLGDIISFQLPINGLQSYKQKGIYRVKIEQYSRDELVQNIKSIGIKIEKKEEIF